MLKQKKTKKKHLLVTIWSFDTIPINLSNLFWKILVIKLILHCWNKRKQKNDVLDQKRDDSSFQITQ